MFEINSEYAMFDMSDIQKSNSNLEKKVYDFLSTIHNSVESVRGNNNINKVFYIFKDEISESIAEEFEEFLRKK